MTAKQILEEQMEITYRNIDDLIPYENNPRFNDDAVEYVANSIKEFGFKVPIIIDKDDVIVAGHTRLKACRKLGIQKVPCVTADNLTDEQVAAFRIIDNKTAEAALWDYEKLEQELQQLDIDMTLFGFYYSKDIEPFDMDLIGNDYVEYECPACGRKIKVMPNGEIIHED